MKTDLREHYLLKSRNCGYFCSRCKFAADDPSKIRSVLCLPAGKPADDDAPPTSPTKQDLEAQQGRLLKMQKLQELQLQQAKLQQLVELKKQRIAMEARKKEEDEKIKNEKLKANARGKGVVGA